MNFSAVAFAAGLALGGAGAWWVGAQRLDASDGRYQAAIEKLSGDHERAVRKAAEDHAAELIRARETETALRADIDRIQADHEKERAREKAAADRTIADLRAGTRRLSVAVRSCSGPGSASGEAGAGSTSADGGQQARAELDPQAAGDLVAVARDGDDAIRALNACVDAYEATRRRINGGP